MSHDYSTRNNKNPKVQFQQYLYNSSEPRDNVSNDSPSAGETELLESSHAMRKRFRYVAQIIRNRYS